MVIGVFQADHRNPKKDSKRHENSQELKFPIRIKFTEKKEEKACPDRSCCNYARQLYPSERAEKKKED